MEEKNKEINNTIWREQDHTTMMKILKEADKLGWSKQELLTIRDMIIEIGWYREHKYKK